MGFYLSFMAVGLIFYVNSYRLQPIAGWRQALRIQGAMSVGLLPLSLLFFQQLPLQSFLANSVAIPWMTLLVIPLVLVGGGLSLLTLTMAAWCWRGANFLLQGLWPFLSYLAHWQGLIYRQSFHSPWQWGSAMVAMLWLLAPRGWPGKWLALLSLVLLLLLPGVDLAPGSVQLQVLDVGQGLAVVLRTQHHAMLYDAGPRFNANSDMGLRVVVPYLRYAGISHLDKVMISHGDNDHSGGLSAVMHHRKVGALLTSAPRLRARWRQHGAVACHIGQYWRWDGVSFQVLYPPRGQRYQANHSSCVLRVCTRYHCALLPGDIEAKDERYLVKHEPWALHAAVLVAPHHGSASSSLPKFIQQVHPRYVIFASGYRNRYHFPKAQVVERYHQRKARTVNTASSGAVQLQLSAEPGPAGIHGPLRYRQLHQHLWSWRA